MASHETSETINRPGRLTHRRHGYLWSRESIELTQALEVVA